MHHDVLLIILQTQRLRTGSLDVSHLPSTILPEGGGEGRGHVKATSVSHHSLVLN